MSQTLQSGSLSTVVKFFVKLGTPSAALTTKIKLKNLSVNKQPQTGNAQSRPTPANRGSLTIEDRISRLESIVGQIGEAVLITTETIERLAERVDALAVQVQHQGHQVQQQDYQIFALSDAVQTLAEAQNGSIEELGELTKTLQRLATAIEAVDH